MKYVFSIIAVVIIVLLARRKLIVYNRGAITNKPVFGGSITEGQVGDIALNFLNNVKNWVKKTKTVSTPYLYQPPTPARGLFGERYPDKPPLEIAYTTSDSYYWENILTKSQIPTDAGSTIPPTISKP